MEGRNVLDKRFFYVGYYIFFKLFNSFFQINGIIISYEIF